MTRTPVRTPTPPPSADLRIVKTGLINSDGTLTFTLQSSNAGPTTAQGVTVNDTLNDRIAFLSASTTKGICSYDFGHKRLTCTIGTLGVGGTATVTIRARVLKRDDFDNTAKIFSSTPDPVGANSSSKFRVRFP